uniref:Transposase n=1 Tax=Chelydra serpentina TaxID=8475 RepID=A0A8C3SQF4_CHESE
HFLYLFRICTWMYPSEPVTEDLKNVKNEIRVVIKYFHKKRNIWNFLLLQYNESPHTSQVAVTIATKCGFHLLPHPAYSPDLAPSDFLLLPKLKEDLCRKSFSDDHELLLSAEKFLDMQDKNLYRIGIVKLQLLRTKCIHVKGGGYTVY